MTTTVDPKLAALNDNLAEQKHLANRRLPCCRRISRVKLVHGGDVKCGFCHRRWLVTLRPSRVNDDTTWVEWTEAPWRRPRRSKVSPAATVPSRSLTGTGDGSARIRRSATGCGGGRGVRS